LLTANVSFEKFAKEERAKQDRLKLERNGLIVAVAYLLLRK
jgi:hypothetical protein